MKMLDLFSGIGGISLAAEWAGVETVAFCEIEPFCQKVLNKHWPDVPVFEDVTKLNRQVLIDSGVMEDGGTIEIICGGYPCQPFSYAGQRRGEEDDRHLWPYVKELLQEIRPNWFVGENVAGHVTLGLDTVLSDLESIGYAAQSFIIPAASVNAPHRRDRVFIVANSTVEGLERKQRKESEGAGEGSSDRGKVVAHPNSKSGLQTGSAVSTERSERITRDNASGSSWTYQPGIDWWAVEPGVGRVANGVPNRVDRLKSLGNAVVPQQIYPIFEAIMKIENQ